MSVIYIDKAPGSGWKPLRLLVILSLTVAQGKNLKFVAEIRTVSGSSPFTSIYNFYQVFWYWECRNRLQKKLKPGAWSAITTSPKNG